MASRPARLAATVLFTFVPGCEDQAPPGPLPGGVDRSHEVVRTAIEEAWNNASVQPQSAQRRLELSLLLDANGFDDAAAQSWKAMVPLAPADGRPAYFLALQQHERGNTERALELMAQARSLADDHAPAAWRAGFWLLDQGRPDEARALFMQARRADPTSAAADIGLARADLALDRTDAAVDALGDLVRRTRHPYTIYLLGQALRRAGRGDEAAALPMQGTPGVPRFPDAWEDLLLDAQRGLDAELDRADRLLEDGRTDDAALCVRRALAIWPDQVHLLNRLGEVHKRRGDTAAWIRTQERAIEADPESFPSHLNLSMALRAAGANERALSAAVVAASLRDDLPEGHLQIARMHLLEERPADAIVSLDRAFELGINDPAETLQYAGTLLQVGRLDEAIERAESVVRPNPTLARGWVVLALAHRQAGRPRVALDAVRAGLRNCRDDQGRDTQALRALARELTAASPSQETDS